MKLKTSNRKNIFQGRCAVDGVELESCWIADDDDADNLDDYSFSDTTASGGDCLLDEANGYTFDGTETSDGYAGYGYVTTTEFSGVPIGFMGTEFGEICGFTP